jgi:hypothetical protein
MTFPELSTSPRQLKPITEVIRYSDVDARLEVEVSRTAPNYTKAQRVEQNGDSNVLQEKNKS